MTLPKYTMELKRERPHCKRLGSSVETEKLSIEPRDDNSDVSHPLVRGSAGDDGSQQWMLRVCLLYASFEEKTSTQMKEALIGGWSKERSKVTGWS